MPSNTDYLSKLAHYNQDHGITATFSEMKKTARRMQKLHDERGPVDLDAFFLLHSDPTGEEATDNVMAERAKQNHTNASRRLNPTNTANTSDPIKNLRGAA
jgi:acid phosphatase class B